MGSAGPQNQNIDFMASVSDVDIASNLLTVTWSSDKDGTRIFDAKLKW